MDISTARIEKAQQDFVSMMPDVEKIAGHAFGYMDPEAKEEAVAETTALAWQNHLQCSVKRKHVAASSIAHYAVQNVKTGRCMAGYSSTDVLSPRTRILGRARIKRFRENSSVADALTGKRTRENPFEAVRIKLDYGKFLSLPEVSRQERNVFRLLSIGFTTAEIAGKLHVSPPRVCQVKNSLGEKLLDFFGSDTKPDNRKRRRNAIMA